MAGHSHSANIAIRKGAQDKKRGKLFGKLSRAIIVAARSGGGDPTSNLALRYALDKARKSSMPKDNIDRAVKKGTGAASDELFEDMVYEGYAPGGVALLIECVTDNKNRSSADVRTAFNKGGGSMGSAGSVMHQFHRKGEVKFPAGAGSEDAVLEAALESGADDVVSDADEHTVYTAPDQLYAVATGMKDRGFTAGSCKLVYVPGTTITLTDLTTARAVLKQYHLLDDLDDTQDIHANFEIADDIVDQLEA